MGSLSGVRQSCVVRGSLMFVLLALGSCFLPGATVIDDAADAALESGVPVDAAVDALTDVPAVNEAAPDAPVDAPVDAPGVPTCTDRIRNGSETDIDCGGSCPKCAIPQACSLDTDCASGNCTLLKCAAATCGDLKQDNAETDVDCGGPICSKCGTNLKCLVPADCQSSSCSGLHLCG